MRRFLGFILIFMAGCSNKAGIKTTFYDNGNIKEKFVYVDTTDITTYRYFLYNENGILKESGEKIKGNTVGNVLEYYQNGIIKYNIPFSNGKANGIVVINNEEGLLTERRTVLNNKLHGVFEIFNDRNSSILQQMLFVKGRLLIKIDGGDVLEDGELVRGKTYFYIKDSSEYAIGSFSSYVKNGKRQQKYCTYFETLSRDTISFNDVLRVKIVSHIGLMKGHNIELHLGDIDENYEFVAPADIVVLKSNNNILEFDLDKNDYRKGINLIMGKLKVYKDGEDITNKYMISSIDSIPYIFFKQFYVSEE